VILHGGPGSQSKPKQVKGFDLEKYHVITFDQRGCGKSEPAGQTAHNTLSDLISDMERLREHLEIETWFVAGGSWGSTLALAYAQMHPGRVKGLLLSSIFLAREQDLEWAFTSDKGIVNLFPDVWDERLKFLANFSAKPQTAAKQLLDQLENASPDVAKQIAAGVQNWEGNLMNAFEDVHYASADEIEESDVASAKIFLHYEANQFFLEPNQLLNNVSQIQHIPTIIVHGRYDLLCPIEAAWKLQQSFAKAEFLVLPSSNHRLTAEGDIARKLAFKYFLSQQETTVSQEERDK
jgi:proline iminopeptidase